MDIIFIIGLFLLPFENFFFAPSAGWAAITPIVFFLYLIFNIRLLFKSIIKYKILIGFFFVIIIITLCNLLLTDFYISQAISRMISALISFGLGFISLFCFDIYFNWKGKSIKNIEKIIIVAYSFTFCIGILQYLTIKFNIVSLYNLFEVLSKRNYLITSRVQYCFTEPSFIGMHLFGVLLPIYICGRNKKIRNLIAIYVFGSIFFKCSLRIIIDTIIVLCVFYIYKTNFRKMKNIIMTVLTGIILLFGFNYIYSENIRFHQIVNQGIYSDGSFSARWFRINASIKGYMKHPLHTMLGYGLGQEIIPLKEGYYDAREEYDNYYLNEVLWLENAEKDNDESVSFCLYIRIISEWGGILFLAFLVYLIGIYKKLENNEWKAQFICILYLYIQFESYGFYSLWIFLVLVDYQRERKHKAELEKRTKVTGLEDNKLFKKDVYGSAKNENISVKSASVSRS